MLLQFFKTSPERISCWLRLHLNNLCVNWERDPRWFVWPDTVSKSPGYTTWIHLFLCVRRRSAVFQGIPLFCHFSGFRRSSGTLANTLKRCETHLGNCKTPIRRFDSDTRLQPLSQCSQGFAGSLLFRCTEAKRACIY